jgi:2-phosphosulfolactate phosphatase
VSEFLPQQKYQVRFDVGLAGFRALSGHADVVILADALPAVDHGPGPACGAAAAHLPATHFGAQLVIEADLGNPARVAEWVLARQAEKAERFSVAVIAVGERRRDGSLRPAVEDFLLAGSVIDELSRLGIDHCSPEAAAPSAGFLGLTRALRHLVSASETAAHLSAAGRADELRAAVERARPHPATDAAGQSAEIVAVREFRFPA